MLKQLIVIRHGQPSLSGRFLGHSPCPLSARGIRQAQRLSLSRCTQLVDIIYSSDLNRAAATAAAAFVDRTVITDTRLRERRFGDWEGMTREEVEAVYPHSYRQWRAFPRRTTPPGGESYPSVQARATSFICDLPDAPRIAVVTHLGVIRIIIACILRMDPECMRNFSFDTAGVTVIDLMTAEVIKLNDTCHLRSTI